MVMAIDIVKETTFKSIAVVISPLTSLMQDQVKFLLKSIAAEFIRTLLAEIKTTKGATARSCLE